MYFNNIILKIDDPRKVKLKKTIFLLVHLFLHVSVHYPELIILSGGTLTLVRCCGKGEGGE